MAAFLPHARQTALLKNLKAEQQTARTLTKKSEIEQEWEKVRRQGYAINNEETIVGAVFLACPVFDARGEVCGGISVGVPKARYSAELGKKIADHLKDCSRRLSESLEASGYMG